VLDGDYEPLEAKKSNRFTFDSIQKMDYTALNKLQELVDDFQPTDILNEDGGEEPYENEVDIKDQLNFADYRDMPDQSYMFKESPVR